MTRALSSARKIALGVAHLTALALPPPEFIEFAGEAGFDWVGLRLLAVNNTTPAYSLMTDARMLRQTRQAIENSGVTVNDIEFVRITAEFDVATLEPFLHVGAELGAKHVITAPYDPDLNRLVQNLGALGEAASAYGVQPVLEFFPWTNVPDLGTAFDVVSKVANYRPGILLDTLHFNRSHSRLEDIAAIPPDWFAFIHLCDAEILSSYTLEQLLHTARAERLIPGTGKIGLHDIVKALPPDIPVSVEIPMERLAGEIGYNQLLKKICAESKKFLSHLSDI